MNFWVRSSKLAVWVCVVAVAALAQDPGKSSGAIPVSQAPAVGADAAQVVRARVTSFYGFMVQGDKVAALDMVAPASKNDFLRMDFSSVVKATVKGIEVTEAGDSALVSVARVHKVPGIPQLLDMEVKDTWTKIEGQWYYVPPAASGVIETPFGKIKVPKPGEVPPADAAAIQRRMDAANRNVDPDQYMKALDKVVAKQQSSTKSTTRPPANDEQKGTKDATDSKAKPKP